MKTTKNALATMRETSAFLKAELAARELADDAARVKLQDALTVLDAARHSNDADAIAVARLAVRDARHNADDAADAYAAALYRFSNARANSVLRRAGDVAALAVDDDGKKRVKDAAPLYVDFIDDADAARKKTAPRYDAIIAKLKNETTTTARVFLAALAVNDADAKAADDAVRFLDVSAVGDKKRGAGVVSDVGDVMHAAALAVLETRATRRENADAAAAENVGIFDYEYMDDGDSKSAPACDVKRVNRAAERYINGRRGLALRDFRTLYILDDDDDAARIAYSFYKQFSDDADVMHAADVADVDDVIAALNLTATQAARVKTYIAHDCNLSETARIYGVTRHAVEKTLAAVRAKAAAYLDYSNADDAAAALAYLADTRDGVNVENADALAVVDAVNVLHARAVAPAVADYARAHAARRDALAALYWTHKSNDVRADVADVRAAERDALADVAALAAAYANVNEKRDALADAERVRDDAAVRAADNAAALARAKKKNADDVRADARKAADDVRAAYNNGDVRNAADALADAVARVDALAADDNVRAAYNAVVALAALADDDVRARRAAVAENMSNDSKKRADALAVAAARAVARVDDAKTPAARAVAEKRADVAVARRDAYNNAAADALADALARRAAERAADDAADAYAMAYYGDAYNNARDARAALDAERAAVTKIAVKFSACDDYMTAINAAENARDVARAKADAKRAALAAELADAERVRDDAAAALAALADGDAVARRIARDAVRNARAAVDAVRAKIDAAALFIG